MLGKTIKYFYYIATGCLIGFLYLVYFGENRVALILNQLTFVPADVHDINIKERRGLLGILTREDFNARATCITTKQSFNEWLGDSHFELIHCQQDTIEQLFATFDSLPQDITNFETKYTVQLQRNSHESRLLIVTPLNGENVLLEYEMN